MDKKQTVFLSAILGIGSIMMLSFLIISATKANPDCVVSDDLTVTGNVNVGGTLRVPDNGINMTSATSITNKGIIMGVKTLTGTDSNDISISPFTGYKVSLGGNSKALGNFEVLKDTTLGDDASDKVKAYQYCDESGDNCHDASGGWGGGSLSCVTLTNDVIEDSDDYASWLHKDCESGYVATGGGCLAISRPGGGTNPVTYLGNISRPTVDGNGWRCSAMKDDLETLRVYTRCCKVE